MKKLIEYLKPFWLSIIILLALVYAQVMANLALPDYMAQIVNQGIIGQDSSLVLHKGGMMLLIALGGAVAVVGVGFMASRIATGFARNLRGSLFRRIESFSLVEFNSFSTASLITRSTNDVTQIQMVLVMLLRLALMAPFTGIEALRKAYQLAPSMTWLLWIGIGAIVGMIALLFYLALPQFAVLQKKTDKLNLVTREILTGLRVIRAFNTEEREEQKFDETNNDLTRINLYVNRLMVIMQPFMILVMSLLSLAIIWVGSHHIDQGTLLIGNMMAFMQYAGQVIISFLLITMVFIMVPRASVSLQRIGEVLDTDPRIKDQDQPARLPKGQGRVEFKDVTYTYDGGEQPALHNISFTAEPGQTTAIVGSTGSGKTTLVNLIPRFYDVDSGTITVNGVDIKTVRQEDLYRKIAYVSQKPVLFSGSVESNITYGSKVNDQKLQRQALQISQADFVAKLEGKTKASVSQGGTNFSGGQKQRLSIARALLREAEVYIFDDSFSALDYATDAKLRQALNKEIEGKTILIVAQRLSTVMKAEHIVVLDEGRIVGQGRHEDLLRECKVYREIAASQLSPAELAHNVKLNKEVA